MTIVVSRYHVEAVVVKNKTSPTSLTRSRYHWAQHPDVVGRVVDPNLLCVEFRTVLTKGPNNENQAIVKRSLEVMPFRRGVGIGNPILIPLFAFYVVHIQLFWAFSTTEQEELLPSLDEGAFMACCVASSVIHIHPFPRQGELPALFFVATSDTLCCIDMMKWNNRKNGCEQKNEVQSVNRTWRNEQERTNHGRTSIDA